MGSNLVSGQFISGYLPVVTNFCFLHNLSTIGIQIMVMNSWITRNLYYAALSKNEVVLTWRNVHNALLNGKSKFQKSMNCVTVSMK